MWRVRSTGNPRLALALAFVLLAPSAPCRASTSATLWTEGQRLYQEGHYADAAPKLQDLLDHHPGYPDAHGYTELRYQLARVYLGLSEPARAASLLRSYLDSPGKKDNPQEARLALGNAYLDLKQFSEAFLLSQEIEKSGGGPAFRAAALILRARALLGDDKLQLASRVAESAESLAREARRTDLEGTLASFKLELKLRACEKTNAASTVHDEATVLGKSSDRGDCLNESVLLYRKSLAVGDPASHRQSQRLMLQAVRDYWNFCLNPPPPPPLAGGRKRTAQESREYQAELVDRLKQICGKTLNTSLQILAESPPRQEDLVKELRHEVEGLLGKLPSERNPKEKPK